eukprot:scaffold6144_cov94-Isochrysis_galbana.AAC.5
MGGRRCRVTWRALHRCQPHTRFHANVHEAPAAATSYAEPWPYPDGCRGRAAMQKLSAAEAIRLRGPKVPR